MYENTEQQLKSFECFWFVVICVVKEDTLTDMVSCLSERIGLVHQMPFVCDRDGFSGVLEKVIQTHVTAVF